MREERRVLIAVGEASIAQLAAQALAAEGYRVEIATDCETSLRQLSRDKFQVVLFDPDLPGARGLKSLEDLRSRPLSPEVVVLGHSRAVQDATAAMRFGASDYLVWPLQPERLLLAVGRAAAKRELSQENAVLRRRVEETPFVGTVIAQSPRAREALRKIEAVAEADAPVLFSGETGTGKGLMAKVLFSFSHRQRKPFLQVNCGALHEQLIESELFGHRKGSFSGATETKPGLFEIADGGTLFLDEIGELSLPTQASLLQVLDTREFRPVGDTNLRRVDVRIIAATNRDLEAEAGSGRFRRDLFYRLNAVHITLPPLRERREDISFLLDLYLDRFKHPHRGRLSFSGEALTFLNAYDWPGNVRELANLVESSVLLARARVIEIDELPRSTAEMRRLSPKQPAGFRPATLAMAQQELILHTLEHTQGRKAPAARLLGIDIKTLTRKLREYVDKGDPSSLDMSEK